MENVGIYTPPVADPVNAAVISDTYNAELTTQDLEVTESAQQKLAEIVSQSEDDVAPKDLYHQFLCIGKHMICSFGSRERHKVCLI